MTSHLDRALPEWQFGERHATFVAAPPARVYAALRAVTAREIFLFRTLVAIRRCGRRGPESILNPSADAPILDVALRTGFFLIAEEAPEEVVVGMYVIKPDRALAAMNFRLLAVDGGTRLTTETRIFAKDAAARRAFRWYWWLIRPGSGFIRRMWLRAIRKRATTVPPASGRL
jgi:hypothetical protein